MTQNHLTQFVIFFILAGFLLFTKVEYAHSEQQCTGKICFSWAFAAFVGEENNRKLVEITRDMKLKSGDQLKMLIKLKRKSYIYIFYYSAQGQLYMLFPYSLDQFATDYSLSKEYYIPQGNFVFELDDTVGIEKFYLIASVSRLSELENFYGSYQSVDAAKKPDFLKKVVEEIKQLRKQQRKLTVEAERPLTTLGPIRAHIVDGETEFSRLDKIADEYNANEFYAKTITIEHK
jgi:hypothetical protein